MFLNGIPKSLNSTNTNEEYNAEIVVFTNKEQT